jgi:GntR family transcriptional regulator/MocR family aminotransferase
LARGADEVIATSAPVEDEVAAEFARAFYAGEPAQQGVLLGYGGTDAAAIERGMKRLAALMPTLAR